jgi:hypothetical protein
MHPTQFFQPWFWLYGVENISMYGEKYLLKTERFKYTPINAGSYLTAAEAGTINYPSQTSLSVLVLTHCATVLPHNPILPIIMSSSVLPIML